MLDDKDETRQRQNQTSEPRRLDPTSNHFGDLITADHKILNLDGEGTHDHPNALIVQDGHSYWIQSYLTKTEDAAERASCLRKYSCLHSKSQDSSQAIQGSSKRVRIVSPFQILSGSTRKRRNSSGDGSKVVYSTDGGTVRSNVIATCATCTTR